MVKFDAVPIFGKELGNITILKTIASLAVVIATAWGLGCLAVTSSERAVITLNSAVTYQRITEWEGTAQSGELACAESAFSKSWPNVCPAFSKYKDSLFDQIVDLGITRVRLEILPGVENQTDYFTQYLSGQLTENDWAHVYGRSPQNDDNDPNNINWSAFHFTMLDHTIDTVILPLRERVQTRAEKFVINLCFVHFGTSQTGFYQFENPAEYAEFMLATYLHMQTKYGFVPDAIEVMLEPDNNTRFDGTKMGNAIQATITRLEGSGFSPSFIVPSTTNAANAIPYFNAIKNVIGDANVRRYVRELSYHRYAGGNDDTIQSIGTMAASNGIGASMLEWIGASYPQLHKDLTLGGNTAWAQYSIAGTYFWGTDDNGASYFNVDDTDPGAPTIHMMSRTKFIRQYTKFIRPGAVRLSAQSSNSEFSPVAFRNDTAHGGGYVAVVKADTGGSMSLQGLPAGVYGIKYTTSSQYDIDAPDVTIVNGQTVEASIPQSGVITVYAKSATVEPPSQAVITQCSLEGGLLTVIGRNIKGGANVTVGGVIPKKVKFKDAVADDVFTRLVLKGRVCQGLPGAIVITNPGGPASLPFQCNSSCN